MEFLPKGPFPNQFTHPTVFVIFGKTKGEICVEKGDFRGDLGGVLRGLDLVWETATPPTHIWERSPKKNGFFFGSSPYRLSIERLLPTVVGLIFMNFG